MNKEERESLHKQYYKKGNDHYNKEEFRAAILAFEKALDNRPNDTDTLWALGNCYTEYGQPDTAEKYFRMALEVCEPKQQGALIYNLGNTLFDQLKFKEAIVQYESISRENNLFKKAKANINAAKKKIGRY